MAGIGRIQNRTVNCVRDRGHALIKNSVNSWQRRPECLVCIPKTQSSFIIWSLVIAKSAVEDFKGKLDNCKLSEICNISRRHSILKVFYLSSCAELSLRNCFPVILPGIKKHRAMDAFSHLKEYLNQADLLRNVEQNMRWDFRNDADKSRFFLRILQE